MLGSGNGENSESVGANEHKARLAQGEQTCKTVEQVHGHADQGVDSAFFQHGDQHGGGGIDGHGVIQQEEENVKNHQKDHGNEAPNLLFGGHGRF